MNADGIANYFRTKMQDFAYIGLISIFFPGKILGTPSEVPSVLGHAAAVQSSETRTRDLLIRAQIPLGSSRLTCRAHAFYLCRACRTASSTQSTRRARLARHAT